MTDKKKFSFTPFNDFKIYADPSTAKTAEKRKFRKAIFFVFLL